MPSSVARCHRLCAQLGDKFKELGYTRECGYSSFLYPSEKDTRLMLLWLVERLPKTGDEGTEDILGPNALLNRSIAERLTSWTGDTWALHACERHCASGLTTPRYSRSHLATCPLVVPSTNLVDAGEFALPPSRCRRL